MACVCGNEQVIDLILLKQMIAEEMTHNHGGNLITIMQKTQNLYGYLPRVAIEYIAEALMIKPAKVMGVATFYTQFRFSPAGRYIIQLCQGTACHVNGSEAIGTVISETLGITDGQTTQDGLFTLQYVACLGCCSLSPVMMINGTPYGKLTADSVKKILAGLTQPEEAS